MHSPLNIVLLRYFRERLIIPDYGKESVMAGISVAKKEMVSRFGGHQASYTCMIIVRVLGEDVNFPKWFITV